jgi:putative membrane protein
MLLSSLWWDLHIDALIPELILLISYLILIGPLREKYWAECVVSKREVASFLCAWGLLFLTEHSPLHVLSEDYSFTAHMVQHLLFMLVIPPLFIAGTPAWMFEKLVVRYSLGQLVMRIVTNPVVAFVTFNLVLVWWHLPEMYDLAVSVHNIHLLEHLSLLIGGGLGWWPIQSRLKAFPRLSYGLQMLYLFVMSIPMGFLGAIITFTNGPVYLSYSGAEAVLGMSQIMDQQIGGLLMKSVAGVVFVTLLGVVFFAWARSEEQEGESR